MTLNLPSGEIRKLVCFVYSSITKNIVQVCVAYISFNKSAYYKYNYTLYETSLYYFATGKTSKKITHTPTNVKLTFLVAS